MGGNEYEGLEFTVSIADSEGRLQADCAPRVQSPLKLKMERPAADRPAGRPYQWKWFHLARSHKETLATTQTVVNEKAAWGA